METNGRMLRLRIKLTFLETYNEKRRFRDFTRNIKDNMGRGRHQATYLT